MLPMFPTAAPKTFGLLGRQPWSCFAQIAVNQTETDYSANAPWPLSVSLVLFCFCVAIVAGCYVRERRGVNVACWYLAAIRVCLVGILFFMLYGMFARQFKIEQPKLIVLLDNSASMLTVDGQSLPAPQSKIADTTSPNTTSPNTTSPNTTFPNATSTNLATPSSTPQKTVSAKSDATRFGLAKLVLQNQVLKQLDARFRIEIATLSELSVGAEETSDRAARIAALEATESSSRLGERLKQLLANQQKEAPAGLILISDGVTTQGPSLSSVANRLNDTPVFAVALGARESTHDVGLSNLLYEPVVFAGEQIEFDFVLQQHGYHDREVNVRLLRSSTSSLADEVTVKIDSDKTTLRLTDSRPPVGMQGYSLQVDLLEGETNSQNNRLLANVEVRDETIRVLLIQSDPTFEFRYLKSILERSSTSQSGSQPPFTLTTVLQEADPESRRTDQATSFPLMDDEQLQQFDVIILGDVNPKLLGPTLEQALVHAVFDQGRSVLFIAGERYMPTAFLASPLAKLFPFDRENRQANQFAKATSRLRLTRFGESFKPIRLSTSNAKNKTEWETLSAHWKFVPAVLQQGSRTLASFSDDGSPALTYHFAGKGKVVFQYWDEVYRLRFRRRDELLSQYWLQLVRFLGRRAVGDENASSLVVLPEQPTEGDRIRFELRLLDDLDNAKRLPLKLSKDGGPSRELVLERESVESSVFSSEIGSLSRGAYSILCEPNTNTEVKRGFQVAAVGDERFRVDADFEELKQLAKLTNGRYYELPTVNRLASDIPTGQANRLESTSVRSVWNSPWLVCAFVSLITLEWSLRRKFGML